MKADKKIFSVTIVLTLLLTSAGCSQLEESAKIIFSPESSNQKSGAEPKRFQESGFQGKSVVNSAIELSKKYADLSEEKSALQKENLEITTENAHLKEKVAALEPQLEQAKKELGDANDLLIEMRIELNNWKNNIIGFQEKIEDADKAQLEALLKILKFLGGEVTAERSPQQDSTTSSQNEQRKQEPKENPA